MPPFPPRVRAGAIHVAIGLVVAAIAFAWVRYAWYPGALFEATSSMRPMALLAAALLVAGPGATLAVYVPGKWGLRFDLVVIGLLQAAALAFALWTFFDGRPVYIVFVKDRFELVRNGDFPDSELARASSSPYVRLPIGGPAVVGARLPRERIELERIMFLAPTGLDLHHMPQHYVAYDAVREEVKAHGEPFEKLRVLNPTDRARVDALPSATGVPEPSLAFLPLRAGERDLSVLIDRRSGDVLRILALSPW
jgi:hypothetical protein